MRQSSQKQRVLLLGNHPSSGFSMNRYASDLERAYADMGWAVVLKQPSDALSSKLRSGPLRKFAAYLESLVWFPLAILVSPGLPRFIHIADHSNALWLLALKFRGPAIVTCHDLIAVRAALRELPEHRTRTSGRAYQRLVRRGMALADAMVTVSDATRADVERIVPRAKAITVHSAVTAPAKFDVAQAPAEDYLLLVSTSGWRKRREHAVKVWHRLNVAGQPRLTLVSVGPPLTSTELAPAAHLAAGLVQLQGLSDEQLFGLYSKATALLQMSRYEGFGWPIVEANAAGTPAVCTNEAVFREVAGEAGTFIGEDLDAIDWVAVRRYIESDEARSAARANATRFTATAFAKGIDAVAKSVLEASQ